ncbi:Hypothetical predicted protein [Paramuricea clavata]|uniref:Uncharacterized protein n=1 Tax=Paramuricea clavata TaxID=317549 RepID=A0A6S7H2A2_PARCT|nr:Hypothetical predicted protein [Paramuricea clavata]
MNSINIQSVYLYYVHNFTAHRRQWWPNCRDEYKPRPAPPPYRRPRPRPAPRPRPPPPPREETKNFNDLHGAIRSPNYPGYPPNLEYAYIIELPEKNKRIQLTFRVVDLPRRENGDCKKDYIEIYDGITTWSTVTKTICGNESIYQPIISKSYKMKVKFIADRVKGKNRGFDATYDPYQPPRVTNVSQKVTGVVIGTACGLVFLVLTFLAICHSRRLAVLRRHYDDQSLNGDDAIEEKAPPTYYDVMNSPENYPLTPPSSKRKEHHLAGTPQNEALPRYQDLFPLAEPGQEQQSADVASHMSRDVEGVQLTREIKGNDVNESEDRDVRDIDSGSDVGESGDRENDVSENDDKGVDARRESDARRGSDVKRGSDVRRESDVRRGSDVKPERDVGEGDDVRQGSDVKIAMGEFNVDAGGVKREDGSDTVAYQEYSRAITTDV